MSDFEITVTVDANDADYNTRVSRITSEDLERIKPLIEAIKKFRPYRSGQWTHHHNYPYGGHSPRKDLGEKTPREIYPQIDEETHEIFMEVCPYGEYGFHTIKSIEVTPFVEKTKLL